eukprot:1691165-Pleurochrysis_carterae.AAC.3
MRSPSREFCIWLFVITARTRSQPRGLPDRNLDDAPKRVDSTAEAASATAVDAGAHSTVTWPLVSAHRPENQSWELPPASCKRSLRLSTGPSVLVGSYTSLCISPHEATSKNLAALQLLTR